MNNSKVHDRNYDDQEDDFIDDDETYELGGFKKIQPKIHKLKIKETTKKKGHYIPPSAPDL